MGLLPKSKKNDEGVVTCIKSTNSSTSFASAMLCFLHGFNDGDDKKNSKNLRFRLLRKSRSSSNFNSITNMVVANRTHCRTQSAVSLPPPPSSSAGNSASATSLLQAQRSPSPGHLGLFSKVDKASLKLLSTSSPTMTGQSQSTIPDTPKVAKEEKVPTTSKSRQKKFHRHFPTVETEEKVLNYYSCALIGDILLQGHLYITKNYFAFYSNVFGYVTKLLIPMLTVEKITKEKTARIIPNAVGISTADEKHVFGSLLSRDNTFKYMIKIWEISQKAFEESNIEPEVLVEPEILEIAASESDSSETKENESEKESTAPFQTNSTNRLNNIKIRHLDEEKPEVYSNFQHKLLQGSKYLLKSPNQTFILFAAAFLFIILFISASLLLYRINLVHNKYLTLIEEHNLLITDEEIFNQILRFSKKLHTKSAKSITNFIDSNLRDIAKVRHDLELLSSILLPINDSSNDAKENTLVNDS